MKKFVSTILISVMMVSSVSCAVEKTENIDCPNTDLSEYKNNEIFVLYDNGNNEVISFENREELKKRISELANNENVSVFSPNYSYEGASLELTDEHISKQWALLNDGSFYMEEQKMNIRYLILLSEKQSNRDSGDALKGSDAREDLKNFPHIICRRKQKLCRELI